VERLHAGRFQDALTRLQSGAIAAPDADIAKHI